MRKSKIKTLLRRRTRRVINNLDFDGDWNSIKIQGRRNVGNWYIERRPGGRLIID